MDELDVGAWAAASERHAQRVEDQVVRMWPANCQPTIRRL